MDAIIPLMPEHPALLSSDAGAAALDRVFAALRQARGLERVVVAGHDAELLDMARDAGLSAVLLAAPQPGPGGLLPRGALAALERLAADGRRVLVVGCENPLLRAEDIEAFVRNAATTDAPLLSATAPADHPCQLNRHLRLRGSGILLPLDPQAQGGPRLLTLPFRFLWAAQDARGQGPAFALNPADGALFAVADQDRARAFGPLLLPEGPERARLSLPGSEAMELAALHGAPGLSSVLCVGLHLTPGLPCLAWRGQDGTPRLGFAPGAPQHPHCQLYGRGPEGERRASLDLSGDPPSARLPWSPGPEDGPLSYNLLEQPDADGGYDLILAYPDGHGLWRTDPTTGRRVNTATGRPIHGRQEFPDVLQPDGSLFALTLGEAKELDALLAAGRVAPFILDARRSMRLCTPMDLLRYTVRRKLEHA